MLSVQLKENTKEAHQSLEAVVVRRIKSIRSSQEYIDLLHKFHGFHAPMEKLFDQHFTDQLIPSYSVRRKADLILHDIKSLGIESQHAEQADSLPAVDSLAKAVGAFYVLEGSTQGGAIVADMLSRHAGVTPAATSFFNVYGDDKKAMWQSFKEKIDTYCDPEFTREAVDAANDTFRKFEKWMLK